MEGGTLPLGPLYSLYQRVCQTNGDYAADVDEVYGRMTKRVAAEGDASPGAVVRALLEEARAQLPEEARGRFDDVWRAFDTEENRSFLFLGYQAEALLRAAIHRERSRP